MSLFILTEEYNEYDQHGSYYLRAWRDKPTVEQLLPYIDTRSTAARLLAVGGGREGKEHSWYNLEEQDEIK